MPASTSWSTRSAPRPRAPRRFAAVKPGGVIMHIGLRIGASEIDMRKLTLAEITLIGTYTYTTADLRATVAALAAGAFGDLAWVEERSSRRRRARLRRPRRRSQRRRARSCCGRASMVEPSSAHRRRSGPTRGLLAVAAILLALYAVNIGLGIADVKLHASRWRLGDVGEFVLVLCGMAFFVAGLMVDELAPVDDDDVVT